MVACTHLERKNPSSTSFATCLTSFFRLGGHKKGVGKHHAPTAATADTRPQQQALLGHPMLLQGCGMAP